MLPLSTTANDAALPTYVPQLGANYLLCVTDDALLQGTLFPLIYDRHSS
jgi:hypothetical protein